MNTGSFLAVLAGLLIAFASAAVSFAQPTAPMFKRTTFKSEKLDFGSGGTIVVAGAPAGSVRVEGWNRSEVEIVAEIEITAGSEADLDLLSKVTGFVLEESMGRTAILSVGTHDRKYIKRVARDLPKNLLSAPFRIDYVVKVPRFSDLQLDVGRGTLAVSGVEGTMRINHLEGDAQVQLLGGGIQATFGLSNVDITIPTASWRGRFADIQLGRGTMNVNLPPSLSAEVDAVVLRTGRVENTYPNLQKRTRTGEFTERSVIAKAGVGGVPLRFTVGDGDLNLRMLAKRE
jgi:hypothetical protein